MPSDLRVSIGQHSDKGRKTSNQDFHGAIVPRQPSLGLKGVAIAIADGISSSDVGGIASEAAVKSFLTDYYDTPESWSVKTAAQRVIAAANSWLHAQTRRSRYADDSDRGYVTTLSVLVLKAGAAHVFHVGDCRIWRLSGKSLEQLTEDHRVVVSSRRSYLGRALGVNGNVEIDYRTLPIAAGDVFVLTGDGVHESLHPDAVAAAIAARPDDLDAAARFIAHAAYDAGSDDNLTVQIVRVDATAEGEPADLFGGLDGLTPAPVLEPPTVFDGYRIIRSLHASSRSHVYLATDLETGAVVALKAPSVDLRDDADYLRRFMMEEWVARRLDSPYVMKAHVAARPRSHIYLAMEYIEGQTLARWMIDNPAPDLDAVRRIVEQIVRGVRAFHRREMVHQDLRPQNVLIDVTGTARLIDFGSTKVAGVAEIGPSDGRDELLGTVQYTAPECLLGEPSSERSDIFSIGVITYQMLTGQLPYGTAMARARSRPEQRKLRYAPARDKRVALPSWIDDAIAKAVSPDPARRHQDVSEFLHDLNAPKVSKLKPALIEQDPVRFWQVVSLLLTLAVIVLTGMLVKTTH